MRDQRDLVRAGLQRLRDRDPRARLRRRYGSSEPRRPVDLDDELDVPAARRHRQRCLQLPVRARRRMKGVARLARREERALGLVDGTRPVPDRIEAQRASP
ncbi:MAG: hypothetical protein ACXVAN_09535, partial [Polyangia bacterium]